MHGRPEVCLARPRSSFRSEDSALPEEDDLRLTKGERRLMHTLMDMEEDDRLDYEPKPTEQIVEKLMKLGFIEVKVTAKGRAYMNEG